MTDILNPNLLAIYSFTRHNTKRFVANLTNFTVCDIM